MQGSGIRIVEAADVTLGKPLLQQSPPPSYALDGAVPDTRGHGAEWGSATGVPGSGHHPHHLGNDVPSPNSIRPQRRGKGERQPGPSRRQQPEPGQIIAISAKQRSSSSSSSLSSSISSSSSESHGGQLSRMSPPALLLEGPVGRASAALAHQLLTHSPVAKASSPKSALPGASSSSSAAAAHHSHPPAGRQSAFGTLSIGKWVPSASIGDRASPASSSGTSPALPCAVRVMDVSKYILQRQRGSPLQGVSAQTIMAGVLDEVKAAFHAYSSFESLCHPVAVSGDAAKGAVHLVYPLLTGYDDLGAYWRSLPESRRTEVRLAGLIKRVVSALLPLHAETKIHGSIKASNIMISRTDQSIVFLDHGMHLFERYLPQRMADTVPWQLPPEVLGRSIASSPLSMLRFVDVWALGLLGPELLKGVQPLAQLGVSQATSLLQDSSASVAAAVLEGPFPDLYPPGQPGREFSDFVALCLTRKTASRPSCQSLLGADPFLRLSQEGGMGGHDGASGSTSAAIPIARPAPQRTGMVSPTAAAASPMGHYPGGGLSRAAPTSQPSRKADIPALLLSGIGKTRQGSLEAKDHMHSPRFASSRGADSARASGTESLTVDMSPRDSLGLARRGSTPTGASVSVGYSNHASMLDSVVLPAMDAVLSDVPASTAKHLFTLVNEVQTLASSIETQWGDATTLLVKEMIGAIESSPVSSVRSLASAGPALYVPRSASTYSDALLGHHVPLDVASNASSVTSVQCGDPHDVAGSLGTIEGSDMLGDRFADGMNSARGEQAYPYPGRSSPLDIGTPREDRSLSVQHMRGILVEKFLRKNAPHSTEPEQYA